MSRSRIKNVTKIPFSLMIALQAYIFTSPAPACSQKRACSYQHIQRKQKQWPFLAHQRRDQRSLNTSLVNHANHFRRYSQQQSPSKRPKGGGCQWALRHRRIADLNDLLGLVVGAPVLGEPVGSMLATCAGALEGQSEWCLIEFNCLDWTLPRIYS